jgi:hypothetical protein
VRRTGRADDQAVARAGRLDDRIIVQDDVARDDVAARARDVDALDVVAAELRADRDGADKGHE